MILKRLAEDSGVEFMCTAFDFNSVDFLEDLGIASYKVASGDLTNIPLLEYIAQKDKPMFLSTGASTLEEIHVAYDRICKYHDKICLLHAVCAYPAEYAELNLRAVQTLRKEFPDAIIGYSGHDNGILAAAIAYMLGATVVEKHFTLNHAWKGTDHKFSLEREGLRKQVRDLKRVSVCIGNGEKVVRDFEVDARRKMGKALYAARGLPAEHILTREDIAIKSPAEGLSPYYIDEIIGKKLRVPLSDESVISWGDLEPVKEYEKQATQR
jgi:N-acetylneuraminate synthase/sialic acid synthase